MTKMSPEAIALADVLLDQHRRACLHPEDSVSPNRAACLITYKTLCERAKLPFLLRSLGPFLAQIADWCRSNQWPQINALAVSQDSHIPGYGYDGAPGCSLEDWETDVQACIDFRGYPGTV
jgi:hypothetical protein